MGQNQSTSDQADDRQHASNRDARNASPRVSQGTRKVAPPFPTATGTAAPSAPSTTPTPVHAKVASHARGRSLTAAPKLRAEESTSSQKSQAEQSPRMGNSSSKPQPQPLPVLDREKSAPLSGATSVDGVAGGEVVGDRDLLEAPGSEDNALYAPATYSRPPRLPLPISEEVYSPGSPIITPQDISSPLDHSEVDGVLPRRGSVLSSTTADDEDFGDGPEVFAADPQSVGPVVPTLIQWHGQADKVYVTGTFVNWERKYRLHPDPERGGFSAILPLHPGTHHIKFLIGGDMVTSDNLPTTVDYTNILVNYIEVVAPLPPVAEQPPTPAEPVPIPGAAVTAGQADAPTNEAVSQPLDIRTAPHATETATVRSSTLQETISPGAPQPTGSVQSSQPLPTPTTAPQADDPEPPAAPKQRLPRPRYTSEIPAFLLDLDAPNPEDERVQRAKRVEGCLPQPPSLPMFLGKSILNSAMPHKDDASVLVIPNHTVLNHLATSSIKNGVLATSGTTRYKRKFLTTIMYKPTSDDG
ncbi:carbohydrate-binding module family 48 protein [Baudoinia panamericana UAMH 10762]|uniref:Carbohydrate-binding module family 48 protein n=1 Tax=Baudoinia panamericana (strain UAMH 10762) TaxID=717646 RepID=M2NDU8_BAUPA|nr:carbohydrate-binding module family 48 protein [Baudoinia panamericana UAMH 10762]EMC97080.1 carbohydrate-binding module family 48 protein [Baudoinia panamericana UAMH 10762]